MNGGPRNPPKNAFPPFPTLQCEHTVYHTTYSVHCPQCLDVSVDCPTSSRRRRRAKRIVKEACRWVEAATVSFASANTVFRWLLKPDSAPNGKSNTLSAPESGQPDCAAPVKESPGKEGPKDRWLEAFNSLPEEEQKDLKAMGFDNLKSGPTTVADLVSTVEKKQEECQDKFWKVKAGGKEIVFREYTESIVGWLTKAGDIAVQFAPPQASLPWGLVKNLMNVGNPSASSPRAQVEPEADCVP